MSSNSRYYYPLPLNGGDIAQPGLQEYDSEELNGIDEYEYQRLQPGKKRIRLIKLKSGHTENPEIVCQFYEAEYDTTFHMPKRISHDQETRAQSKKADGGGPRPQPITEDDEDDADAGDDSVSNGEAVCKRKAHETEKREELADKRRKMQRRTREQRESEEKDITEQEMKRFEEAQESRVDYEALSWCWAPTNRGTL